MNTASEHDPSPGARGLPTGAPRDWVQGGCPVIIELTFEELLALRHTVNARVEFLAERIAQSTELADAAQQRGDRDAAAQRRGTADYWQRCQDELVPLLDKIKAAR